MTKCRQETTLQFAACCRLIVIVTLMLIYQQHMHFENVIAETSFPAAMEKIFMQLPGDYHYKLIKRVVMQCMYLSNMNDSETFSAVKTPAQQTGIFLRHPVNQMNSDDSNK
jgi:hypothetical protein